MNSACQRHPVLSHLDGCFVQFCFAVKDFAANGLAPMVGPGVHPMEWLERIWNGLENGEEHAAPQVGTEELPIPIRDASSFVAGRLPEAFQMWDSVFIPKSGASEKLATLTRKWLSSAVHLPDFFKYYEGEAFGEFVAAERPAGRVLRNLPFDSSEDAAFARQAVAELVRTGAAVRVDLIPKLVLPIGVAINDAGKRRLILDARYLNLWTPSPEMSYETLTDFRYGLKPGDLMFSVDHKSGYHHVPLTEESREYVGFHLDGQYYMFTVLPFGIAPACYIYNTLSSVLAGYLRAHGVHLIFYIDDFGVSIPKEWPEWKRRLVVAAVFVTFFCAGYYVSLEKCDLALEPSLRLLGFTVDTANQRFAVPQDKWERIHSLMIQVLEVGGGSRTTIESLVGKLQALALAVPCVPIFLRSWHDLMAKAARRGKQWIAASASALADLEVLEDLRSWEPLSSWKPERHVRLETDASDHGWGAALFIDGVQLVGAPFDHGLLEYHISVKETLAVEFALEVLGAIIPKPCHLDVYVDNTAVQFGLLKGSSPDELARTLARSILAWQLRSNVTIHMHRITTKSNVLADTMSRLFGPSGSMARGAVLARPAASLSMDGREKLDRGDHKLGPEWFAALQRVVEPEVFTIDICASPGNAQLPRFITREFCSEAVAMDALAYTFPLGAAEYVYCNPPWTLIAPLWVHLRQCRVAGAMLFPWVPMYRWFGMVQREAKRCFVLAPQGAKDVFLQPSLNYNGSVGPIRWPLGVALFDFSF
jgi:Reverse transcriptase (RNA-dependent DNA polymerase)